MKFGVAFANIGPFIGPEAACGLATAAERAGFESIWTVDHVVVPAGYRSTYPYDPSGRLPSGEDAPFPDPLIWLAYVARATSTIRLATGILILPERNPVVLAKELATLDLPLVGPGDPRGGPRMDEGGVRGARRSPSRAGGPGPRRPSGPCGPCGPRSGPPTRGRRSLPRRLPAAPAGRQAPIPIHIGGHSDVRRPTGGTDRRRLLPLRRRPARARRPWSARCGGRPRRPGATRPPVEVTVSSYCRRRGGRPRPRSGPLGAAGGDPGGRPRRPVPGRPRRGPGTATVEE